MAQNIIYSPEGELKEIISYTSTRLKYLGISSTKELKDTYSEAISH